MKPISYIPINSNRKVLLPIRAKTIDDNKYVIQMMMMFVFVQSAEDVLVELLNTQHVKGAFKWEKAKITESFNTLRKRRKRLLTQQEMDIFDDIVCFIADKCFSNLEHIKNNARAEFAQKIPYDQIEAAVQLGTSYGCVKAAQKLNKILVGKQNNVFDQILDNLGSICDKIGFRALNNGIFITPDYCADAWEKMIKKVGEECSDYFSNKKKTVNLCKK